MPHQPSDSQDFKRLDHLPLTTLEEIAHSEAVDRALEKRANRRKCEGEADAVEIANDDARFELTKKKLYLAVGLVLLSVLLSAAVFSWFSGEESVAVYLAGAGGGVGTALRFVRPGGS